MYKSLIVPPNIGPVDTIIQVAYGLDFLQKTINSIFEKIDSRISQNNGKVEILKVRITVARTKIKSFTGSKKSIKIYSPGRFPSLPTFADIRLTFAQCINKRSAKKLNQSLKYDMKRQMVSSLEKNGNFQFFLLRCTNMPGVSPKLESATKQVDQGNSLDIFDETILSVNSLLFLNETLRIYTIKNDEKLKWKFAKEGYDNQVNSGHEIDKQQKKCLGPAPYSMANKALSSHRLHFQRSLFYTPKLNKAPEMNLPPHLPYLPGIVDDVQFICKDQEQIAPSLFIDNLPDFAALQHSVGSLHNLEDNSQQVINRNSFPKPLPPPPPPPPPISAEVGTPSSLLISEDQYTGRLEKIYSNSNYARNMNSNARSDLMDAIRRAGGTGGGQLRAAANVKLSTSQIPQNSATASCDLLADLHNKLLMRRKGISGLQDREAEVSANNTVINHLSKVIPPPPARRQKSKESTDEDSDWMD